MLMWHARNGRLKFHMPNISRMAKQNVFVWSMIDDYAQNGCKICIGNHKSNFKMDLDILNYQY